MLDTDQRQPYAISHRCLNAVDAVITAVRRDDLAAAKAALADLDTALAVAGEGSSHSVR